MNHLLIEKAVRTMRHAEDAAINVAENFFDEGDGPYDDLMRCAAELEEMQTELNGLINEPKPEVV